MVKKLLTSGALAVDLQDSHGNTPAHKAAGILHEEMFLLLVERNPKVVMIMNTKQQSCMEVLQNRGKQMGK